MARWAPFLAVVVVLTVLLLLLARQSQRLLREAADSEEPPADGTGAIPDAEDLPGADDRPDTGVSMPRQPPAGLDGPESGESGDAGEHGEEPRLTSGLLLANVATTQAVVAAVVLGAAWYFSIPASAVGVTAEPLASGTAGVAVGTALGVALWLANECSTTVADAVGATYDETVRELLAPGSARGWAGLFLVVLPLIAVGEELLFRGALIGVPAAGLGVSPWLLAAVASLAFALGHGAQGRAGILVTGVLGFALAAGYILTGSLLVVVVAHYLINAMEFLVHEYLGVDDVLALAAGRMRR